MARTFDGIATEILCRMPNTTSEFKAAMQDVMDILFNKKILRRTEPLTKNFAAFQKFLGPEGLAGLHGFLQMAVMREEATERSKLHAPRATSV